MWGLSAATLSSLTWAVGTQTYGRLAKQYPPYVINFNRAMISFPLCILAFALQSSPSDWLRPFVEVTGNNVLWLGISMLGSYALADVIFFLSARDLGVPIALAISAIYPLWSALAGWLWNGETLSSIQCLGLLLAILGVITVILVGRRRPSSAASNTLQTLLDTPAMDESFSPPPLAAPLDSNRYFRGVALAFVTSILWSLNTYAVARGGAHIPPMVASGIRMAFAMFTAPALGFIIGPRRSLLLPTAVYLRSGWVFAFESFGGSFFYLYGLTHAPLAIASALSSLAPVIAIPLEWSQTRRAPRWEITCAIFVVIAGVILLVLK